jgi:hypothetical protein
MLERDYSEHVDREARVRCDSKDIVCSLASSVQLLLKTICSVSMMKATMAEIGEY